MSHRFRPPTIRETEQPSSRQPNAAPILSSLVGAGAVTSGQMAVTQEAAWTTSDTTITDTVNWTTVTAVNMYIPEGPWALFIFTQAQWSHSAANAKVDFRIAYGDGTTTVQLRQYLSSFTTATAGDRATMALSVGIDVTANTGSGVKRGLIVFGLQARPVTAGTLTVHGDASVHGFATGDSTS